MPETVRSANRVSLRRAGLLSAGTLLSRILGMLRETLIAATFDVATTDAFFIAWRIPNALRTLLAEGALSTTFVPVFSDTLVHGESASDPGRDARDGLVGLDDARLEALALEHRPALRALVARVRAASLAVLVPLSVLGIVFARPILRAMVGDFGGDHARFDLSAGLLRVLFPYIFFMGSAAVGIGVLQSLNRYAAFAFAPALLNVAFLLSPVAFIPLCRHFGLPDIYAMAFGALLGGALQLFALVPGLRRERMLPTPVLDLRHPAVRKIGRLLAPNILGLAIYQIDILLSNRFLAGLPTGAVSYFSYAQRLADIPQGLFVVAITGSALADLSRDVTVGDHARASDRLGHMLRLSSVVAIPSAVILATYGEALVPLVIDYGHFTHTGSHGVAEVVRSLRWQAVNVALLALVRQVIAAFSAARDTRTPMLVSAVDLTAFVVLALVLRGPLGHAGIAAAIAGSTAVQLALLLAFVHRRVRIPWGSVLPTLGRTLAAAAVAGLCARLLLLLLHSPTLGRSTLIGRVAAVAGGVALGSVYLLAAWLLRIDEVREITSKLSHRLRRRSSTA